MIFLGIGMHGVKLQTELKIDTTQQLIKSTGICDKALKFNSGFETTVRHHSSLSPWSTESDFSVNCDTCINNVRRLLESYSCQTTLAIFRDLSTELGGIFASGLLQVLSDELTGVDLVDCCGLPQPGDKSHGPFELLSSTVALQFSEEYATIIAAHEAGHATSLADVAQAVESVMMPIYCASSTPTFCLDAKYIRRSLSLAGCRNRHVSFKSSRDVRQIQSDSVLVIKRNFIDTETLSNESLRCMEYQGSDRPQKGRRATNLDAKLVGQVTPNADIRRQVLTLALYAKRLCEWKNGLESAYLHCMRDRYGLDYDDVMFSIEACLTRHELFSDNELLL